MKRKTHVLLAALIAGALTSAGAVSYAQTTSDADEQGRSEGRKKQSDADKKAAVAQAKADKKKTEAQSDANEAAADAKVKKARKVE